MAVVALGAGAATAQPVEGLYLGAGIAANFHESAGPQAMRLHTETGPAGLLSLGWGFGNGIRLEVEGSYRENGLARPASGSISTYGGMANLYVGTERALGGQPLQPYLGAGLGIAWTAFHQVGAAGIPPGTGRRVFDDVDGRLAFQAIAGMALPILALPGLALATEYRFLGTAGEARIEGRTEGVGGQLLGQGTGQFANRNHSLLIGLRYTFGRSAAGPPEAAAAPEPVRLYLVHFDWDRSELSDRSRRILAEAARQGGPGRLARIAVRGSADRAATPEARERLTRQRLEAVCAELERLGVGREEIVVTDPGATQPAAAPGGPRRRIEILPQ
jgi:OmpA-OmpF porin, OOP family